MSGSTQPTGRVIRGASGVVVSVRCACGEWMSWQALIETEDRCRGCGYDWQYQTQGFGEPETVEIVVQSENAPAWPATR